MERKSQKQIVILGPTSSGKTSLATSLSKKLNGVIVSADSRQIYKYMDIGTGKIPVTEKYSVKKNADNWLINDVPIYGYDLVTPNEFYSSYDYSKYALGKIRQIKKENKTPLLVGGTGFYIDMTTGRVKPANIKPNFELRERLEQLSLDDLQSEYKNLDLSTENIDMNNPARLIRAIEKVNQHGQHEEELSYLEKTEFLIIGLKASRKFFYTKVDFWAEAIWNGGLIEEVENLLDSEFKNSKKLDGLVYKEAKEYLKGDISAEDALQKMKYSLHAYIRRQQTYFKKMSKVHWIDVEQDNKLETVYNIING